QQIGGLGGSGVNKIPNDKNLIYRYMSRTTLSEAKGTLYTKDYRDAVITIQLRPGVKFENVLNETKDAVEERGTTYSKMTITGTAAMQKSVQQENMQQLLLVFPIALIFLSLVLFFFHRSIKGILIAFIPPAFSLVLTFGTLGVILPELTLISVAVVALLMGLGVDYSIHLMNRLAEEQAIMENVERVTKTLGSTGKAVLLTTVTTMIGFGSLMVSSMPPIVSFGFASAIGILYCFLTAIIIVPCLVLILKYEKTTQITAWKQLSKFVVEYKSRIIVIAIFFAIMSLLLLPQVTTDVNYFDMAPKGISEVEAQEKYSNNFGGGTNFNALLIETDSQGLTHPETINAIYNMQREIEKLGVTTSSVADEIKEISDILSRNDVIEKLSEYVGVDQIIYDQVAQKGIVVDEFSKTIVTVSIPVDMNMDEKKEIVEEINEIAKTAQIPYGGEVSRLTGNDAITVVINERLAEEQIRSMIIALFLVLATMILIFRSSINGFLTMIPVILILIWEPGFLVLFGISLNVITISIASIMIGIGIDYGIHITHRVMEGIESGLSRKIASREAIEKTGISLVEAACTTIAGLASVYFANTPALQEFVLVVIAMTIFSVIAATMILPGIYSLKIRKKS
ncbi:MAG: MMPL family transporter, partial [Candidatus Thermoplasmatota archaeon]